MCIHLYFECWSQSQRDIPCIQDDIQNKYQTIIWMLFATRSSIILKYGCSFILNVGHRASAIFAVSSSTFNPCVQLCFKCVSERQRDIRGIQHDIHDMYITILWMLMSEPACRYSQHQAQHSKCVFNYNLNVSDPARYSQHSARYWNRLWNYILNADCRASSILELSSAIFIFLYVKLRDRNSIFG